MTEERGRAGMNLRKLQTEVHAIAVAKGWWDTERTFGDLIALVHSELSQAFEAYQERGLDGWVEPRVVEKDPPPPSWDRTAFTHDVLNKPCGFASELADVVIRVADMAEHYGVDLQAEDRGDRLGPVHTNGAEMLSCPHGDYRSSVRTHCTGPSRSSRQRQTVELASAQRDSVCRRAGLQVAGVAAPLRQLAYRLHTDEPLVEEWGARPGV